MSKTFTVTNKRGEVFEFIVDDEKYDEVMRLRWAVSISPNGKKPYAITSNRALKVRHWYLHWQIIGKPEAGLMVDHVNRNTLDNRRENLRICTRAENLRNRGMFKNKKIPYKGVYGQKGSRRYEARICINWKQRSLGWFDTPEEAHAAYCAAAQQNYGEFFNSG